MSAFAEIKSGSHFSPESPHSSTNSYGTALSQMVKNYTEKLKSGFRKNLQISTFLSSIPQFLPIHKHREIENARHEQYSSNTWGMLTFLDF